ncbi:MAG TPA: phosphate signaling complex protein PhoU [Methanobacteriaceae archaeon]|nr:phosphate signaling complex protein PhoU [Methanobacteriaceae archaeon]
MERRHPRILFRKRLKELRADVEQMGKETLSAYRDSIKVLLKYDEEKIKGVVETADKIDEMNYNLEHKTLSIIASEQPVASDLRFIEACIKVGGHLKRMGYLAKNITEVAKKIKDENVPEKPMDDIIHMTDIVENMISKSLNAFLGQNMDIARDLRRDDDKVDDLFDRAMKDITKSMFDDQETISYLVYLLFLARILERIADRAENIGDRTIFMITCKKP